MASKEHKGWHSRGYLPHLDAANEIQAVTFRLADAVPKKVVERWTAEWEGVDRKDVRRLQDLRERIAKYEDRGIGACELRDPRCAEIVQNALLFFDGERYRLMEWCVMPNHVHVLVHCVSGFRLGDLVGSWKGFTAREINRVLGRSGPLWGADYHDRYIRDEDHLANCRNYIRQNPVKAGLCEKAEDWPWGSAGR